MKHFCQATFWSLFFWCCPHIVDTTFQPMFSAPDDAPKILQLKQEESDQLTALLGGLPTLSAEIKDWSILLFHHWKTVRNSWDTEATIQSLRNENSSSQYLSCSPLPQGQFRTKVNDNKYETEHWKKIFFNWKPIIWICTGNNYWQWTGSSRCDKNAVIWESLRNSSRCSPSGASSRSLIL